MDAWQVAQNYGIFIGLAGAIGGYYVYTSQQKHKQPNPGKSQSVPTVGKKQSEPERKESKPKSQKRKAPPTQSVKAEDTAPAVTQDEKPTKESDVSNAQFAQQMMQARQGAKLNAPKSQDKRQKTVKQRTAQDTPVMSSASSQAGAEADDELAPVSSPDRLHAGDVSDMLEPVSPGPSSIRITAPAQPQRERAPRQPKEEIVESKKTRQNRKKVEERRLAREAEEKERKALEERQRRAAREARGEPAKNGIPISKAPTTSPWAAEAAARTADAPAIPGANGNTAPLLDTFEAGSTGSSNGGLEPDTAATSTTDGERDGQSEDDQVAQAMKQSKDESGWATVSAPKKSKKKADGEATGGAVKPPNVSSKSNSAIKPATNSKPNGYGALNVEDPSNWDA